MIQQLKSGVVLLLFFTLLAGLLYPAAVTALAQALFPHQANGSLIEHNGEIIGSELIGQPYNDPGYFWGRPSATVLFPYNAAASGGSNLGPTNPDLKKSVVERIELLRGYDPGNAHPIPVDLVTASASGLDPHISVAAAMFQVPRVARERGLSEEQVIALVRQSTQGRQLGILGEPRVNVLRLNLALDGITIEK